MDTIRALHDTRDLARTYRCKILLTAFLNSTKHFAKGFCFRGDIIAE